MKEIPQAAQWIARLQLERHVEGGAFREIYRSALVLPREVLTTTHKDARNAMTSIYFLLQYGDFSAFHRIASDELWHHYDGDELCVYEITTSGALIRHVLGKGAGASPVVAIRAGSWFGSRVEKPGGYCLCGCTVAPGFDFADFELAYAGVLIQDFPQHEAIIGEMTRQ